MNLFASALLVRPLSHNSSFSRLWLPLYSLHCPAATRAWKKPSFNTGCILYNHSEERCPKHYDVRTEFRSEARRCLHPRHTRMRY